MADTARLQVSIESRNTTGPDFDALRRNIAASGVDVSKFSVGVSEGGQAFARFGGTIQAESAQAVQALDRLRAKLGQGVQITAPDVHGTQGILAAEERTAAAAEASRLRASRTAQSQAERDAQRQVTIQQRSSQQALDATLRAIEQETNAAARVTAQREREAQRQAQIAQRQAQIAQRAAQQELAVQQATATRVTAIRQALVSGQAVTFTVKDQTPQQLEQLRRNLQAVGVEAKEAQTRVTQTGQRLTTVQLTPTRQGAGTVLPSGQGILPRQLAQAQTQVATSQLVRQLTQAEVQSVRFGQALSGGLRAATGEMGKLAQGIGHGLGLFSSFGAGIGTAVVTAAIVGTIAKTTQATGEFERQVRGTNALLDLTGDAAERSFGRMQRDVRAAGVELGVGATNAAKGLYDTISAGIPIGQEAFGVLRASSKLAVGGMTDLATATDGVTSVLNAYRLTAADVDHVTDQMFQTQNIGKITVAQLSQNIGTVVPLAAAMGVNFAEVGGNIASATQQGLRSGQAIEGMRAALQAFLKPSDDAAKLAASLGVGFDAATVRSKGFSGALSDVVKATGGSEALLGRLFGDVQAINFAFAVTGQNAPATARAVSSVGAASGTAARAAEEVERSGARAFERFGARAEELGLRLGTLVLPKLTEVLEGVTHLGAALGAWPATSPPDSQVQRYVRLAKAVTDAEQAQQRLNATGREALAREQGARQNAAPTTGFGEATAPPGFGGALSERQREVAQAAMGARELTVGFAGLGSRVSETASQTEAFLTDLEILDRNFRNTDQSATDYLRDVQRLGEAQAEASRQADLANPITVAQARALLDSAEANKRDAAATEENKRKKEELARTMEAVAGAQKQLAQFAEQAPGRAEQDALRQLREGIQRQERTEQRKDEEAQRQLEERARSLQETAEQGRDALQLLRDSAADARGELEALARVRVQGTAEQENRVFALGTRAAQDQLVIEQARLARLQARQAGQSRPSVDRAALRAAARDLAVAQQEATVAELQGRTTIAPAQRAVDQVLQPPQELPGGDLLRRAQAARAAVTRVEGESEEAFQRRQREAEAQVRSKEREAQVAQREAQERSRADALHLQGLRDQNAELLDRAEVAARNAEMARQQVEYEKQLQIIIEARKASAAQLRSQGVSEEEIQRRLNAPPAPNAPDLRLPQPPPTGAAGTITDIAKAAGVDVKLPPEFSAAERFRTAGQDAATGFAQGLQQGGDAADAAAQSLALRAISGAQNALEEHSPSLVFQRIGLNAVAGLIAGLRRQEGVEQSLNDLLGTLPDGTTPAQRDLPVLSAQAIARGAGGGQGPVLTIASGAMQIAFPNLTVREEADMERIASLVSNTVFGGIRQHFGNTPESESAGARYGRSG